MVWLIDFADPKNNEFVVAKAKAAGKYKGRKPLATELRQEVVELASNGVTKTQIARQLNIGEASVYRILAGNKKHLNIPVPS